MYAASPRCMETQTLTKEAEAGYMEVFMRTLMLIELMLFRCCCLPLQYLLLSCTLCFASIPIPIQTIALWTVHDVTTAMYIKYLQLTLALNDPPASQVHV